MKSSQVFTILMGSSLILTGCGNFEARHIAQGPAPGTERIYLPDQPAYDGEIDEADLLPEPEAAPQTTPEATPQETKAESETQTRDLTPEPEIEAPKRKAKSEEKSPIQKTKPARSTKNVEMRGFWDERVNDGRKFTQWTADAIDKYGQDLLEIEPRDVKDFCPAYKTFGPSERKAFWVRLVSALAAAESTWDPAATSKKSSTGSTDISKRARGLLQLSFASTKAYGCEFDDYKLVNDAKLNLECGIRIMNWWMLRDGVIAGKRSDDVWVGLSRYWSPMRSNNRKFKVVQSNVAKTDLCKN